MGAVLAVALAGAVLVAVAGAQKVLDPAPTAGALRQLGRPVAPLVVRLGAAVELALGVGVVVGPPALWWAVAASYLGFSAFVVAALRAGTPIGSCGCFGRVDTPPSWRHVMLNAAFATAAVLAAAGEGRSALDRLADGGGPLVGVAAALAATLALRTYSMTTTMSPEPTD